MDFSIITKIWLIFYRDHPFSTWAKFSEKLTFLTTWYAHVRQIQRKYLWSGFFNSRPSTLSILLDKGRKLSVHKSFRRRPICFLNVLYTFNLRPVARVYRQKTLENQGYYVLSMYRKRQVKWRIHKNGKIHGTNYSRMDQVTFMEGSL